MNSNSPQALALVPPSQHQQLSATGEIEQSQHGVRENGEGQARKQRNPLLFAEASQPDIVRAHQKDGHYRKRLEQDVLELANTWMGQRFTMQNSKSLKLLSGLIYFTFTTSRGVQTLGEEFCDIRQVEAQVSTTNYLLSGPRQNTDEEAPE